MKKLAALLESTANESVGGRVIGAFVELRDLLGFKHLSAGSKLITQDDVKKCLAAVDVCQAKINSLLSGKGLLGIGQ